MDYSEIAYHPGMSLKSRSTKHSSIILSSKEIAAEPLLDQAVDNNIANEDSRGSMQISTFDNINNDSTNTNNNHNHNFANSNGAHTTRNAANASNATTNATSTTHTKPIAMKTIDQIEHGKLVPHIYTSTDDERKYSPNMSSIPNTSSNNITNNIPNINTLYGNSVKSAVSVKSVKSVASDMSYNSNLSEMSKILHPLNKYRSSIFGANTGNNPSEYQSVTSVAATVDELDTLPNMDELDNYDRHKELGNGTDAFVYEVVDRRDKSHVAMKLTKRKSGRYRTEIHLLHQLRTCPYVVKLLKVLEDDSVYVLILEQAPMTLEQLLHERCTDTPMQERVGREIMQDVLKGVSCIHLLGFLHKDIKPENVLIFADRVARKLKAKIADFGFATRAQYTSVTNVSNISSNESAAAAAAAAAQSPNSVITNGSDDGSIGSKKGLKDSKNGLKKHLNGCSTNNNKQFGDSMDSKEQELDTSQNEAKHVEIPSETLSEFMERVSDKCGTPGFWAPELVAGCVILEDAFKMDVFSAGVTLYRMLCNEMPFGLFEKWETKVTQDGKIKLNKMKPNFQVVSWIKTQNVNQIDDKTKLPKIDYIRKQSKQELSKGPAGVEDLLRGMLRIRLHRRFTIKECLAHEWFKNK